MALVYSILFAVLATIFEVDCAIVAILKHFVFEGCVHSLVAQPPWGLSHPGFSLSGLAILVDHSGSSLAPCMESTVLAAW